ncbi:MAG: tetratricopeptide repeat protein, partial [Actinobacteria bacterium]|nr:tetratricopeptide repeat protein [Actinomycetota bacterium]
AQMGTSGTAQPWQSLNARVLEALKAGDYGEGPTKLAEQALSVARSVFGNRAPQTLASLSNLAVLYTHQARYRDAEPLLVQVLQAERATLGDRNPQTLTAFNNLAQLYTWEGRNRDAEPLFREALQTSLQVLGGPPSRHAAVDEQPRRSLQGGGPLRRGRAAVQASAADAAAGAGAPPSRYPGKR